MFPKRADDYSGLPKDERRIVFFARAANRNCWHGSCSALTEATRQNATDAVDAINATYSRSSGKVPNDYDAFECSKCGSVHFGFVAACACCSESDDNDDGEVLFIED